MAKYCFLRTNLAELTKRGSSIRSHRFPVCKFCLAAAFKRNEPDTKKPFGRISVNQTFHLLLMLCAAAAIVKQKHGFT